MSGAVVYLVYIQILEPVGKFGEFWGIHKHTGILALHNVWLAPFGVEIEKSGPGAILRFVSPNIPQNSILFLWAVPEISCDTHTNTLTN